VGAGGAAAQGQRSFALDQSIIPVSSDNIAITATDLGNGLLLSYDNLGTSGGYGGPTGYVGNIFKVELNLPGSSPALNAASFGNSLYAIANANLDSLTGSTAFQLTFTSPMYGGRQIAPLLEKTGFKDAFREGWR